MQTWEKHVRFKKKKKNPLNAGKRYACKVCLAVECTVPSPLNPLWFSDLPSSVPHSVHSFPMHISARIMSGCNQFQIKLECSLFCQGKRASAKGTWSTISLAHWRFAGSRPLQDLTCLRPKLGFHTLLRPPKWFHMNLLRISFPTKDIHGLDSYWATNYVVWCFSFCHFPIYCNARAGWVIAEEFKFVKGLFMSRKCRGLVKPHSWETW